MCGIVGMSFRRRTNIQRTVTSLRDLRDTFTNMLAASEKRGASATGVVLSYHDFTAGRDRIKVLRAPVRSSEFVKSKEYMSLIEKVNNDTHFIFGHTRAVTSGGAYDNRNNHPHRVGQIIGVHNGMIRNDSSLWNVCKAYGLKKASDCDSEAIFAAIEAYRLGYEKKSLLENAAESMRLLRGWFSVMFMDVGEPDSLYFGRDMTTDLHMCWLPTERVALIASEMGIIRSSAKRVGFTEKELVDQELSRGTLYKLKSISKTDMAGISVEVQDMQLNTAMEFETEEDKRLRRITTGAAG